MRPTDNPLLLLVLVFIVQWVAAQIGSRWLRRKREDIEIVREDFGVIIAAALTLLGLIIGFTFSMAITRYDQRKNLEEEEANAIGTQYLRADLLPAPQADRVRKLLREYVEQRIRYYTSRDDADLAQINSYTSRIQSELWQAVQAPAVAQPTPISALAVAGMNDVINSQGYTQAAWWNRIPPAAWWLMISIAVCCNLLIGAGTREPARERVLMMVLPLIVSISFFLIADIDSPRGGMIRVQPMNLQALADSVKPR